jgi:riboflavin synthase
MFTGIIQQTAFVVGNIQTQDGKTLKIRFAKVENVKIGDSIAINGCCLTVIKIEGNEISFYVSMETLKQTTLMMLATNDRVNIETAMLASTPLGGHIILGHVDEVAKVVSIENVQNTYKVVIEVSNAGKKFLIKKGSIAIDGISLTIMAVKGRMLELNVIPHTWNNTTLSLLNVASNGLVNVEFDHFVKIIGKKIDEHFANR